MLSATSGAAGFDGQFLSFKALKAGANTQAQEKSAGAAPQAATRTESARPVEAGGRSGRIGTSTEETDETDGKPSLSGEEELTEEEERQVRELKQRDAEVRAHEEAHAAVGGSYTSAPSYQYTTGPDGKRYITDGEVQIDASPVRDNPGATIRKMDIVIRAALAPAEPSSQDIAVARKAQQERSRAQTELLKQRAQEQKAASGGDAESSADRSNVLFADRAYSRAADRSSNLANSIFDNVAELSA